MRRLVLILTTAAVLSVATSASSASAATEFGSDCAAVEVSYRGEVSVEHSGASPLPVGAPSSGILTEWSVSVGALLSAGFEDPPPVLQELYVLRPVGPLRFLVVGKADSDKIVSEETNYFKARIPIQKGDLLGLGGGERLYCETYEPNDKTIYFYNEAPVGSTFEAEPDEGKFHSGPEGGEGLQVPVVATIEPDADGDGYGDETQDGCPQSALYHEDCPTVSIATQATVRSKAVSVDIATSISAPVSISASVGLGKGKKATLSAPAQTVGPGNVATFSLNLKPAVIKKLKTLTRKKALTATLTASAPNLSGPPSSQVTSVKLPGHARGAR